MDMFLLLCCWDLWIFIPQSLTHEWKMPTDKTQKTSKLITIKTDPKTAKKQIHESETGNTKSCRK